MSFLSNLAKSVGGESTDDTKKAAGGESDSTTGLFGSAKVLAEAAQSQFNKDASSAPIDNKKVAEAAADVLDAAQKYGKLDETQGIGQYVEKAETYLHQYGGGDEKPPAATTAAAPAAAAEETKVPAPESEPASAPAPESAPAPAPAQEEEKKSEGGADYLKMAGDFLSKK